MSYATGRCDWCDKYLTTWSWVWRLAPKQPGAFCSSRCHEGYLLEQVEVAADLAYDTLKEMEDGS